MLRRTLLAGGLAFLALLSGCGGSQTAEQPAATFANATAVGMGAPAPISGTNTPGFPQQFLWGFSTAGYQVEGSNTTSQWYFWELAGKTPDKAGIADDFLHRWPQDLDLAQGVGVNGFRMGIEWSRIEPQRDQIDQSAVQYYHDLIKGIRARGMTPVVTLLHFSFPQWLEQPDSNGLTDWESPATVDRYLKYVQFVVQEYGADVQYWLTFNEPNIWVPGGWLLGLEPPGHTGLLPAARAAYNVLQAHARAYDLIHQMEPGAQVSSNIYQILFRPFANGMQATASEDFYNTDWFMNAIQQGSAPIDVKQAFGNNVQMQNTVSLLGKIDYVAFDYYYPITSIQDLRNELNFWLLPVYPQGLYQVLMKYNQQFGKPQLIAENGLCSKAGALRDDGWTREAHLVQHANQVQKAIQDGANVLGYFYWSLVDNYEWGSYIPRCGMYSVDVMNDPSLARVATPAVGVYHQVITTGITPDLLQRYAPPQSSPQP